MISRSGALSDEDEEDERSRQIRLRRERAEQELAAAKVSHQVNGHIGTNAHHDDDEDTFNDVDIADLDAGPLKYVILQYLLLSFCKTLWYESNCPNVVPHAILRIH